MDAKKIGSFLKVLRKEKGLTQEQLAEILYVSGRTVSRWETGTSMPELGILIQMAEFYDVELNQILDGERKGDIMNQELQETLYKVADYNKLEKEKAVKAGNLAFGLTFCVCAAAILIQMIVMGTLPIVLGETVTLLTGGIVYIGMMVHNGLWITGAGIKSTPFRDILISVACSFMFTAALVLSYIRLGANAVQTVRIAMIFFAGTAAFSFALLRILAFCNQKRREKLK